MALEIKEIIQQKLDATYRIYKSKGLTYKELLLLQDFKEEFTSVIKDLTIPVNKSTKSKNDSSEFEEKQIKFIESLKMNNPLWDIE